MRLTILVVEDHPAVRHAIRSWLASSCPDCTVLEAASGEEALERCAEHRPDLVLMDINLPGTSGIETTRQIRSTPGAPPVVIVSLYDTEAHRRDATAAGAAAFVAKDRMGYELLPVLKRLFAPLEKAR
ncbi:MAG: response regulator transcription factor [Thermoanaerobaculaceae bacterium]|nr:response regulator transcription factor [Thermoanaerobaculaceae bacterium]